MGVGGEKMKQNSRVKYDCSPSSSFIINNVGLQMEAEQYATRSNIGCNK